MMLHVCVRAISSLLLAAILLRLPTLAIAQSVSARPAAPIQPTLSSAEGGTIPAATTYSDYREVGGMRVPYGYIESSGMAGRTMYQGERVEIGVTLAADIFTLQPSTASGRRR
jgi:hypothetical protein